MAWIQKATRMLEGEPEGAEHGWLQLQLGVFQRTQDISAAAGFAAEAESIGARHDDKDLFALGHALKGLAIAFTDDPERGLPMVEEATQGAVAGELGARATGWIYCMMIAVNAQLADWKTAGHWTEAAIEWCNRQAIDGFPGVCRIHRAEQAAAHARVLFDEIDLCYESARVSFAPGADLPVPGGLRRRPRGDDDSADQAGRALARCRTRTTRASFLQRSSR